MYLLSPGFKSQLSRIIFLLSSVLVAGAGAVALRILHSHPDSRHLTLAAGGGLLLLGIFWIRSLERRLKDAGLPRWFFWPYLLFVLAACFGAHERHLAGGPQLPVLFVLLQMPAFLPQSASASQNISGYLRPVGRYLFILRVLLIAAFGAAFFHLALRAGQGAERWEMALGLVILGFAWIYNVEGRVLDARLPGWVPAAFCTLATGICLLPLLLHRGGIHAALVLFLVLHFLTVFIEGKSKDDELEQIETRPLRKAEPMGGFEFAIYLLLIAGLWAVLHLLRGDVTGFSYAWAWQVAFDAASFSLCLAWFFSVRGRLRDLGLARRYLDLCFSVLLVCAVPVAYRILTFPYAILLFIALQIPITFLRKENIPASFTSVAGEP